MFGDKHLRSPIIEDFTVRRLDINNLPPELDNFMEKAKQQRMPNNASVAAMKIGRWGKEAWWTTWIDGEIISISGCHEFGVFEEDCWRLMARTATLKEYRARAPGEIKKIRNDFNWGYILPHQIKFARSNGAKRMVFTTNSDQSGDPESFRTNRVVAKALVREGLIKLIASDVEIYSTKQNVWEIL